MMERNPFGIMVDGQDPFQMNMGMMKDPQTGEMIPISVYEGKMKAAAEAQKAQQMASQGLNPDGSPIRPEFQSLLDPATGMMKNQYQINVAGLDPSKMEGYSAYKSQALGAGPSPWALLAQKQIEDQRLQNSEKAAAQAASGMAQARSGLGMRGGLSSGARTSIARQGLRSLMGARQDVNRTASNNLLNLGVEDAKSKQSMLGNLMSSELDVGKYNTGLEGQQKQFNIMRALEEKRAGDTQNLDVWKEQMSKWAAERQAQATEKAGGGGGGGK